MCPFGWAYALYSNSKYRLKFVLNCIIFVISLLRVNFQNEPVTCQDSTMEEPRTFKIGLKITVFLTHKLACES